MGYWSALFHEDQNTWTSAVADVCSTIVSYGVDIPWCVCSNSWSVLNTMTEYATFLGLLVSNALSLDLWWRTEFTIISVITLMNLPFILTRANGSCFNMWSQFSMLLTSLAWLGCFLEVAAGVQTGLVFGGKLFYPSLFLLSLVFPAMKIILSQLEKEMYGWGYNGDSRKDERLVKTLAVYKSVVSCESLFFLALATFGCPQWEQNPDISTWLVLFPVLSLYKDVKDYYDTTPPPNHDNVAKLNGDVLTKSNAAAKPPVVEVKKVEPVQKDEKKVSESATEVVKKPEGVKACVRSTCTSVCNLTCKVTKPLCNVISKGHSKVASLPWELITNLFLRYGSLLTYTWIFWKLTDDLLVLGFPLASYVAPMAITKFLAGRISKNWETVLRELCLLSIAGIQYYLFKNNIVLYN